MPGRPVGIRVVDGGPYLVLGARSRRERRRQLLPTCEQAWEALRLDLRACRAGSGDQDRDDFDRALARLEDDGPSDLGWWGEVGGEEYWYGPDPTPGRAERGLSAGERSLLAAVRDAAP